MNKELVLAMLATPEISVYDTLYSFGTHLEMKKSEFKRCILNQIENGMYETNDTTLPNLSVNTEMFKLFQFVRTHPLLDLVLRERVDTLLPIKSEVRYFSKIISTELRLIAVSSIIAHYFQRFTLLGVEGLRLSDVQTAGMCNRELISRNSVMGLMDLMRAAGLVEITESAFDKRSRIFRFTDKGRTLIQKSLGATLLAVDRLTGANYNDAIRNNDFGFIGRHFNHEVAQYLEMKPFSEYFPKHAFLFETTAGKEFLRTLWYRSWSENQLLPRMVQLSSGELSGSLGVSKTHTRHLLYFAIEVGLLTPYSTAGQLFQTTDDCLNLYRNVSSTRLALAIVAAENALRVE